MTPRLVLAIGLFASSSLFSLRADGIGTQRAKKENLDLPTSASEALKEDCPLGFTEVVGRRFEGDAFIFVVDSSRPVRGIADLAVIQRGLVRTIEELPDGVNFAIVAFDDEVKCYPARGLPAVASEATRTEARRWVGELVEADPICPRTMLEEALALAGRLGDRTTMLFYYSLAGVICPEEEEDDYFVATLASTRRRNSARVPIHTIAVGCPGASPWVEFLRRLAHESRGEFLVIPFAR